MSEKAVYFLSDLHLGASYIPDRRKHEARIVDFLRSIAPNAGAVYFLGDVLDYWFEYRTVVPRGFVRFFGQLASMADAGIRITWITGNHDIWLFDYLRDELGIRVIESPAQGGIEEEIMGKRFCLTHGDTFGPQSGSYLFLRKIFHNRLCQKLYASLNPRWTLPFAHGWSSQSRKGYGRAANPEITPLKLKSLESAAKAYAEEHPQTSYIVMGHYHIAIDEPVTPWCRLIVLGDWISKDTYAVFDGNTLQLKHYEPQQH